MLISGVTFREPGADQITSFEVVVANRESECCCGCCDSGRTRASEGIDEQRPRGSTNRYDSLCYFKGEFIGRPVLIFLVANRAEIIPDITQVDTSFNEMLISTIVSYESSARSARRWWDLWPAEVTRLPLCVIQECVVSRVKPSAPYESIFHPHGNPMTKLQSLVQDCGSSDGPAREMVEEQDSAWPQYTHRLSERSRQKPLVVSFGQAISSVTVLPVLLAQIKRRVEEHNVSYPGLQGAQEGQRVGLGDHIPVNKPRGTVKRFSAKR